jgi:hypothetical protein
VANKNMAFFWVIMLYEKEVVALHAMEVLWVRGGTAPILS